MPDVRGVLSKERIVDAAVLLVDRDGLAALTMRRLGRELGVEGMSLYSHFPNKAALLFALVTWLIEEIQPVHAPDADWQERLRAVMRSFRQVGCAHPSIFALMTTRPWDGIALARQNEDLGTLRSAGFDVEQAGYALTTLTSYVAGFVMKEIQREIRESFGTVESAAQLAARARRAEYPYLSASYDYLGGFGTHSDTAFEAGLDLICQGLDALRSVQCSCPPVMAPPDTHHR